MKRSGASNLDSRLRGNDKRMLVHLAAGFTMVELLVALMVMILLLGITAVIYKSASDAMTQTNASIELYQKAEIMRKRITEDIKTMVKDNGVLIVWANQISSAEEELPEGTKINNLTNIRFDSICWFSVGNFKSFSPELTGLQSNAALIFYGPGLNSSGTRIGGTAPNKWVLTRFPGLLIDDAAATNLANNPDPDLRWPTGWRTDWKTDLIVNSYDANKTLTLGSGLKQININQDDATPILPGTTIQNWMSNWNRLVADDDQTIYRYFLENCGRFEIRQIPPGGGASTPFPPGSFYYFTSNNLAAWPKALEFTIRLYDRDLMIKSPDPDQTDPVNQREHGGLTFKFVVPIPD